MKKEKYKNTNKHVINDVTDVHRINILEMARINNNEICWANWFSTHVCKQ